MFQRFLDHLQALWENRGPEDIYMYLYVITLRDGKHKFVAVSLFACGHRGYRLFADKWVCLSGLIIDSSIFQCYVPLPVVKVLCYKSEGRWFDSKWCNWNFSLT